MAQSVEQELSLRWKGLRGLISRTRRYALTDHHLLVGEGAQRFAVSMGHQLEDLLTESSRERWIEWRARV
ncbi:MAG: hypothetical protein Ct9H300mP15_05840 [Gemmatimonadota bacterium]|nr:MAG: hypothetical protein Ct9H300mP15_05840 [Gemmatimonadota bacterium]